MGPDPRRRSAHAWGAAALLAGLLAACGATGGTSGKADPSGTEPVVAEPGGPPPPPLPWPGRFERSALLVADQIAIEGPKGLLDHVALGQDDLLLDYDVETLPEGFRQLLTRKPGVEYAEIRAGIDAWEITALDRILVIERPGEVGDRPIRVVASGAVWWRSLDQRGPLDGGPVERRAERLEFSSE
jgi:hypothetical protein